MAAVRLVFRAGVRRRWRAWLALAMLVALVGGLVLAGAAAGRRTASAFPRFVSDYGYDAVLYSFGPAPALAQQPDVVSATQVLLALSGQPTCACTHQVDREDFGVDVISSARLPHVVKLIAGRLPDESHPDEVLASFTLQQDYGVHVGTVVDVPFYSRAQGAAGVLNAIGPVPVPKGPTIALRVVGVEVAESEFPWGSAPSYDLYATAAFARAVAPKLAVSVAYLVRLRHGASDLAHLLAHIQALHMLGGSSQDGSAASVEASIHPQAIGWWILAALAALAGLAVIGQALGRQSNVESEEYPTLAALGLTSRELIIVGTARNVVIGLAGAAGAIALAFALSPLTPVGEARLAEPAGPYFDVLVLGAGGLAMVVAVGALGIWPAARTARVGVGQGPAGPGRRSTLVTGLAAIGVPPSVVVGARHALERGHGRAAVPVASALLGAVLAVTALCATAVFGSSLSHLTATPALYGDTYQAFLMTSITGPNVEATKALSDELDHDDAIARVTLGLSEEISIGHQAISAIDATAVRGPVLLSAVQGRLPQGAHEIALGASTMRKLGAHLGSVVKVTVQTPTGGSHTVAFTVVATVALPTGTETGGLGMGTGAAFTISGYLGAVCPLGPGQASCRAEVGQSSDDAFLVTAVPGPRGQADLKHYLGAYPNSLLPVAPTSLVNFGEAVNFPVILEAIVGVFGAATLVHLLVVSISRRRREMGLLKALGFVHGQVVASVCWQATTVAVIGLVVGMPLGLAGGQAIWRAFATNLGAVPVTVVQPWLLGALAVGVLMVVNLLAIGPALVATRSPAGQLLRAP